jgi:CBS domain-containing protein
MSTYRDTSVRAVMQTQVHKVSPATPLAAAAKTMLDLDISFLIVDLQDPARGLGIVTQKDIVSHLFSYLGDQDSTTVEEVMSQSTIGLSADWSLETAVSMMRMLGIRRAPVTDHGDFVGLLSFMDVFWHALEQSEPSISDMGPPTDCLMHPMNVEDGPRGNPE